MPDFKGLGTHVNNILGLFPEVLYFRFDGYNGKKVGQAPPLKLGQPSEYAADIQIHFLKQRLGGEEKKWKMLQADNIFPFRKEGICPHVSVNLERTLSFHLKFL